MCPGGFFFFVFYRFYSLIYFFLEGQKGAAALQIHSQQHPAPKTNTTLAAQIQIKHDIACSSHLCCQTCTPCNILKVCLMTETKKKNQISSQVFANAMVNKKKKGQQFDAIPSF